mmetsp:Transcript_59747/g.159904  ORF Transcript_59747/g.159904 Transcript_59747/m.159904 type:complete len:352 (+) Transcript_59747:32-1087(+)
MRKVLTEELVLMRSKCDRLAMIKNLNLWGNDLADVAVIQKMPNLEVLSLSVNKVFSLKDFAACQNLVELYLRKNEVADLNEVSHLTGLENLRTLWLSDNPCASEPDYRLRVVAMLPQLAKLDSTDITPSEREQAANLPPAVVHGAALDHGRPSSPFSPIEERRDLRSSPDSRAVRQERSDSNHWSERGSRASDGRLTPEYDRYENGGRSNMNESRFSECVAPPLPVHADPSPMRRWADPVDERRPARPPAVDYGFDAPPHAAPVYRSVSEPNPEDHSQDDRRGLDLRDDRRDDFRDDRRAFASVPRQEYSMRSENILCAVLALVKELDSPGCQLVMQEVDRRMAELEGGRR